MFDLTIGFGVALILLELCLRFFKKSDKRTRIVKRMASVQFWTAAILFFPVFFTQDMFYMEEIDFIWALLFLVPIFGVWSIFLQMTDRQKKVRE